MFKNSVSPESFLLLGDVSLRVPDASSLVPKPGNSGGELFPDPDFLHREKKSHADVMILIQPIGPGRQKFRFEFPKYKVWPNLLC